MALVKPKFKNIHNKSYETLDGIKWDSRAVAVVAHVWFIKNGEPFVLLGKRSNIVDNPNKWNIPCGYLDWNENLQEAMFREVWEETGLDLSIYHGSIVYCKYLQPWLVYAEPDDNKQNVAIHLGVVVDLLDDKLPELSLNNMENNESSGAYWIHYYSALQIPENEWAFNHLYRMKLFGYEISNVLKKYSK